MKINLTKSQKKFDKLSLSLKVAIIIGCLLLIWLFWHLVFWKNLQSTSNQIKEKISILQKTNSSLKTKINTLEKKGSNNLPPKTTASKDNFLSPQQTKAVLHELLKKNHHLVLLNLNNLPATPIPLPEKKSPLFKHSMSLTFSGNYFSILNYLKTVEKLPWKIYWNKLEYRVTNYPAAEITLTIDTVNTKPE